MSGWRLPAAVAASVIGTACSPPPPSPFGEDPVLVPTLFAPGIVSTDAVEYGITFTPNAGTAFFTRRALDGRQRIFESRFDGTAWTRAEVASFSTGVDQLPFVTADGARLLFSSRRPGAGFPGDGGDNLWVTRRGEAGWSEPVPLPGDVNRPSLRRRRSSTGSEIGVVLHGATLYYSTAVEGRPDLFSATERDGRFVRPQPLTGAVNTGGTESSPAVSPDGRWLVFQGHARGVELGADDLFYAERREDGWSDPMNLGPRVNTSASEGFPSFSPDGRYLFFASDRGRDEGDWSIYYIETAALWHSASDGEAP